MAQPLAIDPAHKPFVVLMVGVNGAGKTTTIGKLAKQWQRAGHKVMLVAGDTFRAAALALGCCSVFLQVTVSLRKALETGTGPNWAEAH